MITVSGLKTQNVYNEKWTEVTGSDSQQPVKGDESERHIKSVNVIMDANLGC